ncbi:molybdenum ABC transporter ATP-binding protein [Sneathiella sp. P13V-1]|uniref:molybdenum ABC transporter ATP-binding protein n=1 Tax=Sneathiella sp. P13V-1 TaxID=2697366 RepID=UPI00187B3CD2|nr:molybdenum ABC transporter ATP-binding protein [Sneathiella sp. P13V-1]MBE7638215.1 molybdenum ABC transporter ATP-binding protein [Sneathiella sp. P13V-1]
MTDIKARLNGVLGSFPFDVDISIPAKGVTAVFGPSGCGKTTLLRCFAGLEPAIKGSLKVGDQEWQNETTFIPSHKRRVGYVFQEPSLFDHLDVQGNLEYGLKRRNSKMEESRQEAIIDLLGIRQLLDRKTDKLSGGEKQRISIARALLSGPEILLMDEPLSALDKSSKSEIIPFFHKLQSTLDIPILYVSHDLAELEQFADHIVLMENGRVAGSGPILEVLSGSDSPLSQGPEAAVLLDGTITSYDAEYDLTCLQSGDCVFHLPGNIGEIGTNKRLHINASDVGIALNPKSADLSYLNLIEGIITDIQPLTHGKVNVCISPSRDGAAPMIISSITRKSLDSLSLQKGQTVTAMIKSIALMDPVA